MAHDLPESFGRYRLLRLLGSGSMGSVHLARDTQLDRLVALKVPRLSGDSAAAGNREALKRFFREARAAAMLHHPNICPVFDAGEIDGIPFLAMAYLEGRPLSALVRPGQPIAPQHAAGIVRTLALAMQEAHRRGVIHRDLKPSNVIVTPRGDPVVTDFGLARRAETLEPQLTQPGVIMGTPAYMAPEQVRAEPGAVGEGCDIYALGAILYELLTARVPFLGSVHSVLGQVLYREPEPPSRYRDGLDRRLDAICLRAMAKPIGQRYATMADLASALDGYLDGVARAPGDPGLGLSRPAAGARTRSRLTSRRSLAGACISLGVLVSSYALIDPHKVEPDRPGSGSSSQSLRSPLDEVANVKRPATHPDHPGAPARTRQPPAIPGVSPSTPETPVRPATGEGRTATPSPPSPPPPVRSEAPAEAQPVASGEVLRATPSRSNEPPGTINNSIGMRLVPVRAGEFLMGSPDSDLNAAIAEKPRHRVRITRPFYLGMYEVTQGQYRSVMGASPSTFPERPDHPVEGVSWYDAARFCNALSEREGLKPFYAIRGEAVSVPDWGARGYRLPTEAEWEYACRAGSRARYGFGDNPEWLGDYAWSSGPSGGRSHAAGRKLPNAFGLFDMLGNVWEHCWDGFDADYYKRSPGDDPIGPPRSAYRVVRGGSWASKPACCLPAVRHPTRPEGRDGTQGFRLARGMSGP